VGGTGARAEPAFRGGASRGCGRLVKLGEQDRARQAVQELLEIEPELTISGFFARIPVPLESMAKTYADALKAAGLPE
jgi:hypothetical protein